MAFFQDFTKDVGEKYKAFVAEKPAVEVAGATAGGALQGGIMGAVLAQISNMSKNAAVEAGQPPPPSLMMGAGGTWGLARNFAVLTGVSAGLTLAIKKYRNGVEDWKGSAIASFGGGAAFSVSSNLGAPKGLPPMPGMPPPVTTPIGIAGDALRTGLAFAVLQGVIYWIGEKWSGGKVDPAEDVEYVATRNMLYTLGLQDYEKNFRKGQLTDRTLMLLTEDALTDVKIPPGPRLLILNHTAQARAHYNEQQKKGKPNPPVGQLSLALPIDIEL